MADEKTPEKAAEPQTCCLMRRKVVLHLTAILPEKLCGVPDSILADYVDFTMSGPPKDDGTGTMPVVAFRFCPWCGKPRAGGEQRVSAIVDPLAHDCPDCGQGPDDDSDDSAYGPDYRADEDDEP